MSTSSFEIDVQVEVSKSLFGKIKFGWRVFRFEGQRLQILDRTTVLLTLASPQCSLKEQNATKFLYQLQESGQRKLILYLPSQTARVKLEQALSLIKKSADWTPLPVDDLNSLLATAATIVEVEAAQKKPSGVLCGVTVEQVQIYLTKLKQFYDELKSASTNELYAKLLDLEAAYINNPKEDSIAHTVHRLHPLDYCEYQGKAGYGCTKVVYGRGRPLKHFFRACPHPSCKHPWTLTESYKIHIEGETLVCSQCLSRVNYDMYRVAALIADVPKFVGNASSWVGKEVQLAIVNPPVPVDGLLQSFITELSKATKEESRNSHRPAIMNQVQAGIATKLEMYLNRGIGRHHIDIVRGLYRLWLFVRELGPRFDYWMQPIVIQASIVRYQKAMQLFRKKSSKHRVIPTADIELIWQAHQNDPNAYQEYHRKVIDDEIFSYDDTKETWDFDACYPETLLRWSEMFDETYSSHPADFATWNQANDSNTIQTALMKKRWEKHYRLPAANSGFSPQESTELPVAVAVATGDEKVFVYDAPAFHGRGYVIGSPVPVRISTQQSNEIKRLLEIDGYLCSERMILNA